MKGIASACGSATVINAIATGKGAAFAIDLRVKSTVELVEDSQKIVGKVGDTSENSKLIETCVDKALEKQGARDKYGAEVETTADLPIAVGLSSSSAAANATVLATYGALGEEPEPLEAVEIGIDAAFEAKTTVTGAFDDAAASFLGGGVITDNENRKLLKRFDVDPNLIVLIYLPPEKSYTTEVDVEQTKLLSEVVEAVHEKALDGNIYGAQTVNGLLYSSILDYDPKPALEALEAGAESAGLTGTGPAVIAISKEQNVKEIIEVWSSRDGEILQTHPSRKGAKIENE